MKTLALLFGVGFLLIATGSCQKQHPSAGPSEKRTSLPKIEACSLLTGEEIQQVQAAPLKDTKSTETANGQLRISQCYFAAEPSDRSIALTVIQPDPASGGKDAARNSWSESFSRADQPENEADKEKQESLREHRGGEEREKATPPKKIDGIGEEAYWAGTRVGGALYVLKGDIYIRMSLGGPDTENDRIDKTKRLAAKVLQRLK